MRRQGGVSDGVWSREAGVASDVSGCCRCDVVRQKIAWCGGSGMWELGHWPQDKADCVPPFVVEGGTMVGCQHAVACSVGLNGRR
jgi:hypothetical protein